MKKKSVYYCTLSVIIFLCAFFLLYIGLQGGQQKPSKVVTETVMLKNQRGTYTKAQIKIPEDYQNSDLPLVTLSHGFRGNMNSAGGEELAQTLAEHGIATIRMDFCSYSSADLKTAEQINQYTVSTMIQDQLLCIDYMVTNYHIDSRRIGLYGRSLGGRVAMIMANESKGGYAYKALALVAPAGNANALKYYMGGEARWKSMKRTALAEGSVTHQKVILTPEFFQTIESYTPSETGDQFHYPVLVIYNTQDYVVLPETAKECAAAYKDVRLIEITSKRSPHGCEMGFKNSQIKNRLMGEIAEYFSDQLE